MPEPLKLDVSKFEDAVIESGYKASRFNIRTNDKNGDMLLLNTYSNKFIRVAEEQKGIVADLLRKPGEALQDHPAFQELVTRGFLVKKSVDEFRRAEMLHHETIASTDELSLILLPNEDCNFRCTYCYESFAKNFMKPWVQDGVIKYLEKNLHKYKKLHIAWFGGEPLTAMPIIERLSERIMELCKQHKVMYWSSMTTNGYNLTVNVMKKLLSYNVLNFQITLDGIEETHNCTRVRLDGASTFQRIVTNLRNVRDQIPNRTFKIIVRGNINQEVLKVIGPYSDFLAEEFSHDPRFMTHWQPVGNWGGDVISPEKLCEHNDMIGAMLDAADKGIDFSFYRKLMQSKESVCYAGQRNHYIIGSDGIIYKCTIAFNDEINHVGMITEKGTMHLDEDKMALWVTGHESTDTGCQKCFFRPSCQGASCPLMKIKTGAAPCPPMKVYFKDYMQLIAASVRNGVEELKLLEDGVPS
ncbi:radical SAM protein [Tumebacillus sp. ITR2]|uniref:Radical SAM protein n=1 Tax=Tumebacillus amylolyticus TaxID=2801339 RepID=A0ABS1JBN9_9BACL|nr:radical SAM protein [Tumebacillus amylolyticus]MBL0387691.1 radical SAM protein [Tumebacillus amylolyticus]